MTKRHYDWKYIQLQAVMLLKTWKTCVIEVISYSKIYDETQKLKIKA